MERRERFVSTLPITPPRNEDPKLFFFFSPLVANIVAKNLGDGLLLPVNLTGMKFKGQSDLQRERWAKQYYLSVRKLGIYNFVPWRDDDPNFREYVKEAVTLLHRKGLIQVENHRIVSCPCGALELPESYLKTNKIPEGKVFSVNSNGEIRCQLCGGIGQAKASEVLVLHLPPDIPPIKVNPTSHSTRVRQVSLDLIAEPLIISRNRETEFTANIAGRDFYIDIDFAWALLGGHLSAMSKDVQFWTVASRTLRKGILVSKLQEILTGKAGQLIVTPYVRNSPSFSEVALRFGKDTAVFFMLAHLFWEQLEIRADSRLIFWTVKALSRRITQPLPTSPPLQGDSKRTNVEVLQKQLNGERVRQVLKLWRSPHKTNQTTDTFLEAFLGENSSPEQENMPNQDRGYFEMEPWPETIKTLLELFITRCQANFPEGAITAVLFHGSRAFGDNDKDSDWDLAIVFGEEISSVEEKSRAIKILRTVLSDKRLAALRNIKPLFLSELPKSADLYSQNTNGAFFAYHMRAAKLLYGDYNPFDRMIGPQPFYLALSLYQKLQQYIGRARKSALAPERFNFRQARKDTFKMLKDALMLQGIYKKTKKQQLEQFRQLWPNVLLPVEVEFLRASLSRYPEEGDFSPEQFLTIQEKIYNHAFQILKKQLKITTF